MYNITCVTCGGILEICPKCGHPAEYCDDPEFPGQRRAKCPHCGNAGVIVHRECVCDELAEADK